MATRKEMWVAIVFFRRNVNKKVLMLITVLSVIALIVVGIYAYRYSGTIRINTVESPEEVVKKFYNYVAEGGTTSLSEAYKHISFKRAKMTEDQFKGIVLNYPKDMKVKITSSKILKDRAVVTIEYSTASAFGGDIIVNTDVSLDLDEKSKSWKIDFTAENEDEKKN